jgi:hypothetical protein
LYCQGCGLWDERFNALNDVVEALARKEKMDARNKK